MEKLILTLAGVSMAARLCRLSMLFAMGYSVDAVAAMIIDPEAHSSGTWGMLLLFSALGWGASEFDSLAELRAGDFRVRLGVGKKVIAAFAAGLITGLALLSYKPEWGKLAAYIGTFAGAYGGASYITPIVQGLSGAVSGFIQRAGGGVQTPAPPAAPPPVEPPPPPQPPINL